MEGCSRKELEACHQLIDLIPKDAEWLTNRGKDRNHGSLEEKKLEHRLGPPGEDWSLKNTSKSNEERDESLLSLGYFSSMSFIAHKNNVNNGNPTHKFSSLENPVGCASSSPWSPSYKKSKQHIQQQTKAAPSFLHFPSVPQSLPVAAKEASLICSSKGIDLQSPEKKVFSSSPSNTAVPNSSQKRIAPASVVGWPPIRSFRKNLGSNSSKPHSNESQSVGQNKVSGDKTLESCKKGMFVKINMDGVPIGRKVDLNAHDGYEKLSSSVDELFRGLLAAQNDSCAGGIEIKKEEEKEIKGVLDGSGEYTLVYEDNEGDRMLVGDVPWHMFVSTVERLRVLKTSELPMLSLGSKQDKIRVGSKLK